MTKECSVCGVKTEHIEMHHKIPQRFDGPNEFWNLEGLCRSCHVAIEKMYDKRFWEYLDMGPTSSKSVCDNRSCGAEDVKRMKVASPKIGLMRRRFRHYCYNHPLCSFDFCGHEAKPVDKLIWGTSDDGHVFAAISNIMLCYEHRVCTHYACESRVGVFIKQAGSHLTGQFLCYTHQKDVKDIKMQELIRVAKTHEAAMSRSSA